MDLIVDSWAWSELISGNKKVAQALGGYILKTPSLVLAEIYRSLIRKGLTEGGASKIVDGIMNRSVVLDLDSAHALAAGRLAAKESMHLSDAVIYSFADDTAPLLTGDPDFKGKKNVVFIG